MMNKIVIAFLVLLNPQLKGIKPANSNWFVDKQSGYYIFYTNQDRLDLNEYTSYFEQGKAFVSEFFNSDFSNEFDVYIHPNRTSIDETWQKDWNMPNFTSECWMVASGVSTKLDIISPKQWDSLACEHSYEDALEIQRLITHEIVHVFHGQRNKSPNFNNVTGIDWFIEGLAVYVSGQCDLKRTCMVRKALEENNIPDKLDDFWKGDLRYGLSGTLVMYIDKTYGRDVLIEMLGYNHIDSVLQVMNTSEADLINKWKAYMKTL
jgi:hypothetical protein